MAPARSGPRAARTRVEPLPVRHLSLAIDPARRRQSGRTRARQRAISARDGRCRRAGRDLCTRRGHRRGTRGRRRVLRARGQPARALRRLVHAGKPQDDDAALPGALRDALDQADPALPGPAARKPARRSTRRGRAADSRRAHAGRLELGVFRARVPRAADGRRARRRAGPFRAGRHRLHAHDAGPAARARPLPACRRRFSRSARVSSGFDAWRAGDFRRVSRRARDARQCDRHRCRGRQVDLSVRAGHDPVLPDRGATARERADVVAVPRRRSRRRARTPRSTRGQGSARCWRVRHADRPGRDGGRARRVPPADPRCTGALHRAADTRAVDMPDVRRRRIGAPARRSSAVRAGREGRGSRSRRPHPRRLARRFARRQFVARRRHEGYVGAGARRRMLSRHANELYWMARHIERAENTARLLDVTYRTSLLPYEVGEPGLAWAAPWSVPLITLGLASTYYERYPVLTAENALRFMILDPSNTSSIYTCLGAARESARTVRGAITSEMYEDLNSAWIEMRTCDYERIQARGVSDFLDWVKMRSHLFRGVTFGTMLRDEAYHFIRLGTHMERADNTARILDTKYHILLPSVADVGGAVDYYQWASLLQSLSGFEAYRKIYSDVISPRRIAELLILRDDMPRSLHS